MNDFLQKRRSPKIRWCLKKTKEGISRNSNKGTIEAFWKSPLRLFSLLRRKDCFRGTEKGSKKISLMQKYLHLYRAVFDPKSVPGSKKPSLSPRDKTVSHHIKVSPAKRSRNYVKIWKFSVQILLFWVIFSNK